MTTLGRILIILAVFALIMGLTYIAVNATSSSASGTAPRFDRAPGDGPRPDGEAREFRGERRGGGWIFGFIKNVGIVAVIVVLIAIPKSLQKRKLAQ